MIAPQMAHLWPAGELAGARGDGRVKFRSHFSGAIAVLALAAALSGCANTDIFDTNERWFSKPFDWTGRSGGYTFSELQETNSRQRPVGPNDLVSQNGACPPPPMPAVSAPPAPDAAAAPGTMPGAPDAAPGPPSLLGQGIALGMTECEVVDRAGTPASVQLGSNPNGGRTAVITFNTAPRPGIYRFDGGRLVDMDRVEIPAVEEQPKVAKRVVKKKKAPPAAPDQQISTQ
jgi:hypothetical protein